MSEDTSEYQEVAALLCLDIDLAVDCIDTKITREELIELLQDLQRKKDEITSSPETRRRRFATVSVLLSLPVTSPDSGRE